MTHVSFEDDRLPLTRLGDFAHLGALPLRDGQSRTDWEACHAPDLTRWFGDADAVDGGADFRKVLKFVLDRAWERAVAAEEPEFHRRHPDHYREDYLTSGMDCWRQGWQVVPQTRDEERKPIQVSRTDLFPKLPTLTFKHWTSTRQTKAEAEDLEYRAKLLREGTAKVRGRPCNVSLLLGAASANTFAYDNDLSGEAALVADRLADEILGPTPFVRTRLSSDRSTRIYRGDGVRHLVVKTLAGSVEILGLASTGTGPLVTALGLRGGECEPDMGTGYHRHAFTWTTSPRRAPPTDATYVTQAQLDKFVAALKDALGEPKVARVAREREPARYDGTLYVPGGAGSVAGVTYADRMCSDGLTRSMAVDGRSAWEAARTFAWFAANTSAPLDVLVRAVMAEAAKHVKIDGRWLGLERSVESGLRRLQDKHQAGRLKLARTHVTEEGVSYSPAPVTPAASDDEDVQALVGTKRSPVRQVAQSAPDAAKAAERALLGADARLAETDRVAGEVLGAVQSWLDALWDGDEAKLALVQLLIAPTGAGKTTTFLRLLAAQIARRGRLGKSVALMLPSYNNIGEAEGRVPEFVEAAKGVGLKVVVYKGKITGGCLMAEQMRSLMEAKIATSGLCEADVDVRLPDGGREKERRTCEHAAVCPVLQNRRDAVEADLLLLPTTFLGLPVPKSVLDSVAGLVVDERCWPGFLKHRFLPIGAFAFDRADAYVTPNELDDLLHPGESFADRKERRALAKQRGLTHAQKKAEEDAKNRLLVDAARDRKVAGELALRALRAGGRVAQAFIDHREETAGGVVTGRRLAEQAKKVCGRAADARKLVTPNLSVEDAEALAHAPKAEALWEELAFWRVLLDDMDRIERGEAKGETDARLQLLDRGASPDAKGEGGESVRVSWRIESVWLSKATMLMDASASPEIVRKLWGEREVDPVQIKAHLHMRCVLAPDMTWSDRSWCVGKAGDDAAARADAAVHMTRARLAATALGGLFGHGGVLIGSTKTGRYAMHDGWVAPGNVRSMHYGAVAGLDWAKHDLAALAVGRMELPVRVVDAIVAALTYDDLDPEAPIDALGTGLDAAGKPLRPETVPVAVPLRDGSDATIMVPRHKGAWARIVQEQHREEGMRQFIGRLRPVYRTGDAPLLVVMSSVIPSGIVVDAVVHSRDLEANSMLWESVRRWGLLEIRASTKDKDLRAHVGSEWDAVARATVELQKKGVDGCRIGKGLAEVTAHFPYNETRTAYAPGHISQDVVGQRMAVAYRHEKALSVHVVKQGAAQQVVVDAPPDPKFEEAVGTLQDRRDAEFRSLHDAYDAACDLVPVGGSFRDVPLGGDRRGPVAALAILRRSASRAAPK